MSGAPKVAWEVLDEVEALVQVEVLVEVDALSEVLMDVKSNGVNSPDE